ncbi:MAG: hypothetical protein V1811_01245 [Candidatus Micrarchaeota archaeon]
MLTAYYRLQTPLHETLKQKSLKCGLLRESKLAEYRKRLREYRISSREHPYDQYARLKFLMGDAGSIDFSQTHVFLTPKLDRALKLAGLHLKRNAVVLEFCFPKDKTERAPLYLDSTHAENELLVPGSLQLRFLKSIYCDAARVSVVKRHLTNAGLKRVRIVPVSQHV